jgi:ribosomal protein S18 acetylase RimI-like enzyme
VAFAIRSSRPDDLDRLRGIYRSASLSNAGDRQALLDHPQFLEVPESSVLEGRTRVAESASGEVVGFATVETSATEAELVDLFVDPASMRTGVARALINDAQSILGAHGIRTFEVTANGHALAFYEAVGFEVIGRETTPLGSGWRMRSTGTT